MKGSRVISPPTEEIGINHSTEQPLRRICEQDEYDKSNDEDVGMDRHSLSIPGGEEELCRHDNDA
ncbi:MAG: hypothetical protein A2050_08785 [Candidatus Rokubacteria bacterium GWA2_73_35]|nr:MAG: hypothetical protein A2050_08785 [Candidatus Rokubacteria bacterium GWA2_73_35]